MAVPNCKLFNYFAIIMRQEFKHWKGGFSHSQKWVKIDTTKIFGTNKSK